MTARIAAAIVAGAVIVGVCIIVAAAIPLAWYAAHADRVIAKDQPSSPSSSR